MIEAAQERDLTLAHNTASFALAGFAGKLKPLSEYLPKKASGAAPARKQSAGEVYGILHGYVTEAKAIKADKAKMAEEKSARRRARSESPAVQR